MPNFLRERCNTFNYAIAIAHNGLHLASCDATYTIQYLSPHKAEVTVFIHREQVITHRSEQTSVL
jgi:hypothetical protein